MSDARTLSVLLLIRALERGGAERQLLTLARGLHERGHKVTVVTFYGGGPLEPELQASGLRLEHAGKRGRRDLAGFLWRLHRIIRQARPSVVYSSMPAANIAALLVCRFTGGPPVVWRLASSDMALGEYDRLSRLSYRAEALLSRFPRLIIANARAGERAARARGYPGARLRVVHNGIDTGRFARDSDAGAAVRRAEGLDKVRWVIGQVARCDPKKDYRTFIEAARRLSRERDDVGFLCVGAATGPDASGLRAAVAAAGLGDRLVMTTMQADVVPCYSAMDINTLSSGFGEGFPNAVAEAMSCGTPCVVTDVGDSAEIVGNTGEVVTPRSPDQLAAAWARLIGRLKAEGDALGERARQRVEEEFGTEACVTATERLLRAAS